MGEKGLFARLRARSEEHTSRQRRMVRRAEEMRQQAPERQGSVPSLPAAQDRRRKANWVPKALKSRR